MGDSKFVVCRLCLKMVQDSNFKLLEKIEHIMLDTLTSMNMCISSGSAMCRSCHQNLLACYGFKTICIEMGGRKKSMEDLEDAEVTNVKLCSLCFQNIDDEMLKEIALGVKNTLLKLMLERCLPDLDVHQMDTAACSKCFKSLELLFSFINKIQITEDKLDKFCIAKNLNKESELKLLDVIVHFPPHSVNSDQPQIETSLISDIKPEPGQHEFNDVEIQEEPLREENSYINMDPEVSQISNSISASLNRFISSNDISHPHIKLEPIEDIHEFTGIYNEGYLKVDLDNRLFSSNCNDLIATNGSFCARVNLELNQDSSSITLFVDKFQHSIKEKTDDTVNSADDSRHPVVKTELEEVVSTFSGSEGNVRDSESMCFEINGEEVLEGHPLTSGSSQDLVALSGELTNPDSNTSSAKDPNSLSEPIGLAERLLQVGLRPSIWSPELRAEVQALRPKGSSPYKWVKYRLRKADGGYLRISIPPNVLRCKDKNENLEEQDTQKTELNPNDGNGVNGKRKGFFIDLEENKNEDEKAKEGCSLSSSSSWDASTPRRSKRVKVNEVPVSPDPDGSPDKKKRKCTDTTATKLSSKDRTPNLDYLEDVSSRKKKNMCPYCCKEVNHFSRHLLRHHNNEGAVQEVTSLPVQDPERKRLLTVIRRRGNYILNTQTYTIRPIRRPRELIENDSISENYIACDYCLGFFKKRYLGRHRKNCYGNEKQVNPSKRIYHLSETQAFAACSGVNKEFYDSLRLRKEVFESLRFDEISKVVMGDVLICSFGESELTKLTGLNVKATVSNKIRELGRLLLVLRKTNRALRFVDILKPEFFDGILAATKIISGYDDHSRSFLARNLPLHMGIRLKQICDIAMKLISNKDRFLLCDQPEESLKSIERFKTLIEHHWNTEMYSLTLKVEKRWEKPKLSSLISDVKCFQEFVMKEASDACENINKNENEQGEYRKLSECVLALTLLLNRKCIGEIQFLNLKTYLAESPSDQQLESLSESEKMLSEIFKHVVAGDRTILFPKKICFLIDVMLSIRQKCVPDTNDYLFANPETEDRWLNGRRVLRKLADGSGVNNKELFTSNRLREQIATVLQIMNIGEDEMEQFAKHMGHVMDTQEDYGRLPQDVSQIAKVSKLLLAINKGKDDYKGKTLDEIEFSDNAVSDDSDTEEKETVREQKYFAGSSKSTENLSADQDNDEAANLITNPVSDGGKFNCKTYKDDPDGSETDDSTTKDITEPKIKRVRWTQMQKSKLRQFFKYHIKNRIPPKKKEMEKFRIENKELYKGRNWVTMKAYVYNCYRDR